MNERKKDRWVGGRTYQVAVVKKVDEEEGGVGEKVGAAEGGGVDGRTGFVLVGEILEVVLPGEEPETVEEHVFLVSESKS